MTRLGRLILMGCLLAGATGCCASPYRCWQDYVGWNNPEPDAFVDWPPPPVTTPPGPTTPAVLPPPPSVAASRSVGPDIIPAPTPAPGQPGATPIMPPMPDELPPPTTVQ